MADISEEAVDAETMSSIEGCAADAVTLLTVQTDSSAERLTKAVDEFVFEWQKGNRPDVPDEDDLSLTLGSLWGQQLVRELGWEWASVTFHNHDDAQAVGVFSPDRALAIYPFHFIYDCLENDAPVTIMLAFNMLIDGSRIPTLPARGYENVMDNVHHSIPRA